MFKPLMQLNEKLKMKNEECNYSCLIHSKGA